MIRDFIRDLYRWSELRALRREWLGAYKRNPSPVLLDWSTVRVLPSLYDWQARGDL